jgi:AraC-like DNA-binding protein
LPGRWSRSPRDEILRVRLNRAKQLLAQTDLSLAMVAEKVGFEHRVPQCDLQKKTRLTPGQFRAQSRITETAVRLPNASRKVVEGKSARRQIAPHEMRPTQR